MRGFFRNIHLQQGQRFPSKIIKTLQNEHLFCPDSYLPFFFGFDFISYSKQIPLQFIMPSICFANYFLSNFIFKTWKKKFEKINFHNHH